MKRKNEELKKEEKFELLKNFVIEYGKNGKGKIVHFRDVYFENGEPVYVLKLVDISNCKCNCEIGGKLDITEEDFYKNSKPVAELKFYDKKSIKVLKTALDKLYAEIFMWEAC